jgi:hypothetical protein
MLKFAIRLGLPREVDGSLFLGDDEENTYSIRLAEESAKDGGQTDGYYPIYLDRMKEDTEPSPSAEQDAGDVIRDVLDRQRAYTGYAYVLTMGSRAAVYLTLDHGDYTHIYVARHLPAIS